MHELCEQNVLPPIATIRKLSLLFAALEKSGDHRIVGAVYDMNAGVVLFLDLRASRTVPTRPSGDRMSLRIIGACVLVVSALLTGSSTAHAQSTDEGLWSALFLQGRIGDAESESKWRWWFDGHARFFDESDGFATSIVRPGIGYDLTENLTAWAGYAWIRNDTPAGDFDEQRFWQQLTWSADFDWGTIMLRPRTELRFSDQGGVRGLRVRQFARWTKRVHEESRFSFRVWDEVFVELNDTDWGQDAGLRQNRAFAGLGYQLNASGTALVEFGYLNQHLFRESARDSSNHILSVSFAINF